MKARVLVISARFPEHGNATKEARIRGDQVRAFTHISHLARRHAITVISGAPPSSPLAAAELEEMASVRMCVVPKLPRASSAARWMAMGRPAQVGWMTPPATWRTVEREASASDVALAITTRSVGGPLPCPLVVDHVDALSRNLANRARGSESLPIRLFARAEAGLMRRWESRVASFAAGQIATASLDAELLPALPPVAVLPVAWRGAVFREPPEYKREYDVIMSGDMRYPPNREAAVMLADEILPRVRLQRPRTTAIVVGRATQSLGLRGVEVASDVSDVQTYLRRARVAVVPLMKGPSGSPYKVIEAAAAGAALVSTAWAVDCFQLPALRAATVDEFAEAILSLLTNETARRQLATDALPVVEQHSPDEIGRRLEEVLLAAAEPRSGSMQVA